MRWADSQLDHGGPLAPLFYVRACINAENYFKILSKKPLLILLIGYKMCYKKKDILKYRLIVSQTSLFIGKKNDVFTKP